MRTFIYSTVLLFCVAVCSAQIPLVAKYNMKGVNGTITFTQASLGSDVRIGLDLNGVQTGNYSLELHMFRVDYDTSDPCDATSIGQLLGDAIPGIQSGQGTQSVRNIDLSGVSSIEGRSFVMTDGTKTICATIEAEEEYITAFAHLPAYLGGYVIFRQRADDKNADTMIYTNLYQVSATSSPISGPFKWQINSGVVAMDISADTKIANRCGSTVGNLYSPTEVSGTCSPTSHAACSVGNLTGKLEDISTGKHFFNDLHLPLSGSSSVIGKSLVFLSSDVKVACANIIKYTTKEASVYFSDKGVMGSMKFSQRSPLDVAQVQIAISGLQERASGYHIHKWPVPWKMTQGQQTCQGTDVAGHFNPHGIAIADSPAAGTGTPDEYEVGDLSGKFGTLKDKASLNGTLMDTNLQLFGQNNIIGRSIVIHFADGSRWVCANIDSTEKMVVGVASFLHPMVGYIYLKQPVDKPYAETQVYVELNTATTATRTTGHNWHVHQKVIGDDMVVESGRCISVGGHYNPYEVDLNGDYSSVCSSTNQYRCEVGDMSGKHGQLSVRAPTGPKEKAFFTDMQLPLSGPQSILTRAIVIHVANSGAGRDACANIYEQVTRTAAVTSWTSADGSTSITGSIKFAQDSSNTVKSITTVDMQLTNLKDQAGGYHVHEFPTEAGAAKPCSGADVGGHVNIFDAPYPGPAGKTGSDDQYEIGDLSGKFGMLSGASSAGVYTDNNLPLEGPNSIVGRSIVVHKADSSASRWSCGNIEETTPGGKQVKVRAVFTGEIAGTVTMTQMRYRSGELSNTYVVVDIYYKDTPDRETTGHNWHVHVNKISQGDCSTAEGHFNPYYVETGRNYDECKKTNPLRCEMGDQSGKMGQYTIGGGKTFYTDVNLPLEGRYAAVKRSVVFHAQDGGLSRVACADLLPYDADVKTIKFHSFLSTSDFTVTDLEDTTATAVNTMPYNVAVVPQNSGNVRCQTVKIYFLGPGAEGLAKLFGDVARNKNNKMLKPYNQNPSCVAGAEMMVSSILLILACLFISRDQRF